MELAYCGLNCGECLIYLASISNNEAEQSNLMCIYNTDSRADLLSGLAEMRNHLGADETELLALTKTVMDKLSAISDEEFESLSGELIPDFDE